MDYGSTHVWVYESSDEEFVSDSELQEGMWLSDSDDDNEPVPVPTLPPRLAPAEASGEQKPLDQEASGSVTKYDTLESHSSEKKSPTYIEVETVSPSATPHPPPPPPSSATSHPPPPPPPYARKSDKDVTYVEVKSAATPSAPPPPPAPPKPAIKVRLPTLRAPPPPPPPLPSRGIIKNRLVPALRKQKKQRVRWERSDSNEGARGRRARKADTNVLAVKFNKLTGPSHVHTGDAVVCSNPTCTAILSHLSQITDHKDPEREEKVWVCEFCGVQNEIDIVPEERPTEEDTTYMIAPAPVVGGGAVGGAADDSLIIFCIDISGSMCVTTEVPGKFQLKGHERVQGLASMNVDRQNQYMPRQRRDVTYISRLQSVQAAVDHQLGSLASAHPSLRVALVTFSDEVTVIGDGKSEVVTVAGDKLWSSEAVVRTGGEAPLPSSIKNTRPALSKKVFDLEEGGQTALGPAVLLAVTMASRVPGSKVIICTDGLANKGVGNLDDLRTDEDQAAAQTFYEDLGVLALEKNVTVSLVTIKGTDCKTLELGQVADTTGGQVTIVDPLTITKEFSSILANPVIATNVTTKIILHKDLYFRSEESQESVLTIPVGNVTAETELTYEYGARNKKKKKEGAPTTKGDTATSTGAKATAGGATPGSPKVPPLMVGGNVHLPFQLQIEYTAQDGSRCMRVISQAKPITRDREVAERDIDMGVVGTHVAHRTAQLAMEGEFTEARMNALVSQRLMQRTSHTSDRSRNMYANVMEDIIPLENELRNKQQREVTLFGRQYSDDEDEEQYMYDRSSELMGTALASSRSRSEPMRKLRKAAPKKKKAISRRREISDDVATYCYQMKSSKSADYAHVADGSDPESGED